MAETVATRNNLRQSRDKQNLSRDI
jgi:hypothetical protein